jgi:hypothetical protein
VLGICSAGYLCKRKMSVINPSDRQKPWCSIQAVSRKSAISTRAYRVHRLNMSILYTQVVIGAQVIELWHRGSGCIGKGAKRDGIRAMEIDIETMVEDIRTAFVMCVYHD